MPRGTVTAHVKRSDMLRAGATGSFSVATTATEMGRARSAMWSLRGR